MGVSLAESREHVTQTQFSGSVNHWFREKLSLEDGVSGYGFARFYGLRCEEADAGDGTVPHYGTLRLRSVRALHVAGGVIKYRNLVSAQTAAAVAAAANKIRTNGSTK